MIDSIDLEKLVIGGLLKYPDSYAEVASFLSEDDFQYDLNRISYSVIAHALNNKQSIDKYIVAQKINNLRITVRDDIAPFDYLDSLTLLQISPKTLVQAVKDLKVFTRRRQFYEIAGKIRQKMLKSGSMSYEDINKWVDKTFYQQMNSFYDTSDAIDLFEDMYDRAERLAQNPQEEMGLSTPYKVFNDRYGGFQAGEAYVFCARPKNGKTTMLNDMGINMSVKMHGIPCLVLDTEMQTDMVQDRMLAAQTNIPLWYIRTGNWIKHEEYRKRFEKNKAENEAYKNHVYHRHVSNMPLEQIITTIKKWYYTKVGRGNKCIIIYDYLKITGEKVNDSNKEYQVMGEKVSRLKDLVSTDVKAPLLTACQINRSGAATHSANKKYKHADDATAIAMSDRILWFASGVWIFRRKTIDEVVEYGEEFGSHSLIHVESRWQGRDAKGHSDLVKTHDGEVINNFINFDLENFHVKEVGGAEDMFSKLSMKMSGGKKAENPM